MSGVRPATRLEELDIARRVILKWMEVTDWVYVV